jgi:hypothetical protein
MRIAAQSGYRSGAAGGSVRIRVFHDQSAGNSNEGTVMSEGEQWDAEAAALNAEQAASEEVPAIGGDPLSEVAELELDHRRALELIDTYPELGEHATAEQAVERAALVAEEIGRPELSADLDFIEAVHVASGGADAHDHERSELDSMFETDRLGRGALPFQ